MSTGSPMALAPCPLCRGTAAPWIQSAGRDLDRCAACGYAWMRQGVKRTATGQSIYEDAEPGFLDDAQADYYRDATAVDAAREKLAWVQRFVPAGGRLIDVGANLGLFVKEALATYDARGIEPSPTVVAWARQHLDVPMEVGSIYDQSPSFEERFDAVTLFDVIEHVPDPELALQRCRSLLRPGGHLFLTTPDAGSLMARVLGRHWYYVDMDEHIALFNRRNLAALLEHSGFEVLGMRSLGRRYRLSYVARRLGHLGGRARALRIASLALTPLRWLPNGAVRLNLGDVMAVVARRRDPSPRHG